MRHSSHPHRDSSRRLGQLRLLWPYMRPYGGTLTMALTAMLFTASAMLGLGHGLRYLVDEGIGKGDPHLLDNAFGFLLALTLLLAVASFLRSFGIAWVGEQVVADLRRDSFRHALDLSARFYDTTRTGEVLSRLTTDITLVQSVVGNTITFALRNFLMMVGGTVMLMLTSLKLTGFVFMLLPLVIVPILFLGRKVRLLSRQTQERMATVTAQMEEALLNRATVQAYGLEPSQQALHDEQRRSLLKAVQQRLQVRSLLIGLVIALVFGAIVVVLWTGGRDVLAGNISAGQLSSFVFYAILVAAAVGALSEVVGDLQRAAGAAERIIELLHMPVDIAAPAIPVIPAGPGRGQLTLKDVTFHYPTRPDKAALDHLGLTIQPGEKVALVGPSGAGKTTLFQLLLRFYDPQQGRILLDGISLPDMDPRELRRHIAYVPQEPAIFSTTAWENIRYGRPEASDEEVLAAAEAAEALDFLQALPDGMNSYLGERGNRLSGGQKQRVAIARALLRDPALLLLDEATSALDAQNERKVQQALERLMHNRTTIAIAHRLATVRQMDRILVLQDGRIVEEGSHTALLEKGGLYATLARLQFS